ncbi:hypothetical protein Tco_1207192, partial [Tanacetum coccineum]
APDPYSAATQFGGVTEIQVDDKLNFIEEPVEIMDREVKRLKQSRIPIVKVRWNSKRGPEFTWEREDQMQKKYPHLFTNSTPAAEMLNKVTPPDTYSVQAPSGGVTDLPRDIPLVRIEVLSNILRVLRIILVILPEHQSDTYVITMKMEILSVSTSNSTAVAGNPVKETLLKLNLPDHRSILTDSKIYIKIDMEVPGSNRLKDSKPHAHTRPTKVKTS